MLIAKLTASAETLASSLYPFWLPSGGLGHVPREAGCL